MRQLELGLVLAVTAVAVLSATSANGQGPVQRYPTPALSPWFNLYNKQGGPVDNYNMYVRPEMQLRNTLQTQQLDIQHQATGAATLGQQVSQLEESRRAPQPTGGPAGFMNQGRFFGVQGTAGTTAAAGSHSNVGRRTWSLPPARSR